jgi:hypothetical protein
MDQRLRYEQLISEKLEALPIPDMADAIWARIEAQLDIDLPTDDGGGTTPDAPSGPGMIGWGLSVVIIALITAFLINKNKPALKDSTIKLPATQNEQTTPALAPGTGPPPSDNSRTFSNRPLEQSVVNNEAPSDTTNEPRVVSAAPTTVDSIQVAAPGVETTAATTDTIPGVKKRRGVSGVTDEDYRIVPK